MTKLAEVLLNIQPIEKLATHSVSDGMLDVHSIFFTIQGEGPFTGHPAVFIRLAGCNLQCPKCDTDYTSSRKRMTYRAILDEVSLLVSNCRYVKKMLIVITGGEPMRQNVHELLTTVDYRKFYVQIETNGTLPFDDSLIDLMNLKTDERQGVYIVVSPKTSKVHDSIRRNACAWKYVASEKSLYGSADGLPFHALGLIKHKLARPDGYGMYIYLQPQDDKNELHNRMNMHACVESCKKHGYIFQLQTQKYMGVE